MSFNACYTDSDCPFGILTDSDCPFGIFKLLLLYNKKKYNTIDTVTKSHTSIVEVEIPNTYIDDHSLS